MQRLCSSSERVSLAARECVWALCCSVKRRLGRSLSLPPCPAPARFVARCHCLCVRAAERRHDGIDRCSAQWPICVRRCAAGGGRGRQRHDGDCAAHARTTRAHTEDLFHASAAGIEPSRLQPAAPHAHRCDTHRFFNFWGFLWGLCIPVFFSSCFLIEFPVHSCALQMTSLFGCA